MMKEKIKDILYYFLVPKFRIWKPVLCLLAVQIVCVVCIGYYPNLYNKKLQKVAGVVTKVDYYAQERGFTLHETINFQLEGDATVYSQDWYCFNYPAFVEKFFYRRIPLEGKDILKSDKIEFYVDNSLSLYPYKIQHWYDQRKEMNMTTIAYTTDSVLLCYGLEINGLTKVDYKKRGFYSKRLLPYETFFVWILLFTIGMFLLHFYAALFTYREYLKTKQETEEAISKDDSYYKM